VMRSGRIVLVAAALLVLASIPAMAQRPNPPAAREGQVYNFSDIWKGVESRIAALPTMSEPSPGSTSAAGPKQAGPIVAQGASVASAPVLSPKMGGSAIPSMGSGAFLTPRERTGLELKRLIRQLE